MDLALLGSGYETRNAYLSLVAAGHNILAVSDVEIHKEFSSSNSRLLLVEGHTALDYSVIRNILLISYAPLIRKEWIDKARFMNIHCALLPKFRGMHPIQWAIVNGQTSFGYTLHLVDEGIDSGPIIYQGQFNFPAVPSYGQVRSQVSSYILDTLGGALAAFEADEKVVTQDERKASYFTKRQQEDGAIDWNNSSQQIFCLMQAVLPPEMPGAYFFYKGQKIAIADGYVIDIDDYIGPTGKIVCIKGDDIYIKCGNGVFAVRALLIDGIKQPASSVFKVVGISLSSGGVGI
jgi:methionyl-tRNA formyltransferase